MPDDIATARRPSFDDILRAERPALVRLAARLLREEGVTSWDAEDVVQQVTLAAWVAWDTLENPGAYIRTVIRREIERYAARTRTQQTPPLHAEPVVELAPSPEDAVVDAVVVRGAFRGCFAARQPRGAVAWRVLALDESPSKVAAALRLPLGTVYGWVSRDRRHLAAVLASLLVLVACVVGRMVSGMLTTTREPATQPGHHGQPLPGIVLFGAVVAFAVLTPVVRWLTRRYVEARSHGTRLPGSGPAG